jgi:hypothetical protein
MYRISPPVPATDIKVVGVNLNLLANKHVDPRAITKLLNVLYSPQVSSRFGFPITEDRMLTPSGFPISDGTSMYIASKQPLITSQIIDQIKGIFGLIMTLLSIALVVFKWFKNPNDDDDDSDDSKRSSTASIGDHMGDLSSNISKLE